MNIYANVADQFSDILDIILGHFNVFIDFSPLDDRHRIYARGVRTNKPYRCVEIILLAFQLTYLPTAINYFLVTLCSICINEIKGFFLQLLKAS
jgi:hypothetical protein